MMSDTEKKTRAAALLRRIVSAGGTQSLDELHYQVMRRRGAPLEGQPPIEWTRLVVYVVNVGLAEAGFEKLTITEKGKDLLRAIDNEARRV